MLHKAQLECKPLTHLDHCVFSNDRTFDEKFLLVELEQRMRKTRLRKMMMMAGQRERMFGQPVEVYSL